MVCGWCKLTPNLDPTPVREGHMILILVLKYHKWVNFTFSGNPTNWPHMTFDLHLWPLTSWTCEGSYIILINQVWFQSDFNFSNEVNFTFWAHLIIWPRWPFTSAAVGMFFSISTCRYNLISTSTCMST